MIARHYAKSDGRADVVRFVRRGAKRQAGVKGRERFRRRHDQIFGAFSVQWVDRYVVLSKKAIESALPNMSELKQIYSSD